MSGRGHASLVLVGEADPPRLLAQRSELGYVDRPDLALPEEPEAVPADVQRQITADAARGQRDRERAQWIASYELIVVALAPLDAATFARINADLRSIRRILERIDRRFAA